MPDRLVYSTTPGRTDEQWLASLRGGGRDEAAALCDLGELIRRGLRRAVRVDGVTDADLDDATQEALARVTVKLDTFRGDSRFTTWAIAIAVRVAYTTLRRRRWGDRSLEDLGVDVAGPAAPIEPGERGDLLEALRDAIDGDLTPRQRAAVLGELAGMPTGVLAEQLGTNANALYKLHHDARRRLREALAARGFGESDVRSLG